MIDKDVIIKHVTICLSDSNAIQSVNGNCLLSDLQKSDLEIMIFRPIVLAASFH